jgi:ring-1,2-phenylacetyl-CoA epoxidase subunit PaaE
MALKFHTLRIADVVPETTDAYTLVFDNPDPKLFAYEAGQYLTIKVDIGGESYRRAFSLSSCPRTDSRLSVTIKKVTGGKVSPYLQASARVGQTLESYPPLGNFKLVPQDAGRRHIVLIGAGSGITPLMSMLKTVLHAEPGSIVTLVYGNRTESDIIFKGQLERLEAESAGRLRVIHALTQPTAAWSGVTGRLDATLLPTLLGQLLAVQPGLPVEAYLCGPVGMMDAATQALQDAGVNPSKIHRELYSAALPTETSAVDSAPAVTAAPAPEEQNEHGFSYERRTRTVTVTLDGETFQVTVPPNKSILKAVIDLKKDPPYACLEGLCSTCRCKVHDGYIEMDEREGLSDEELEAGYALACQAHPLSDNVVIEFA